MPVENSISFMDYLNKNAGAIQVICTTILAAITFGYMWLTKNLLRFQKESEEYRLQQEIINGAIKFLYKVDDEIDKLAFKKDNYLETKKKHTVESKEVKALFFDEVRKVVLDKQFIQEIKYISFQLRRLKDKDLWKDLEQIGDTYEKLFDALAYSKDMDECKKINSEYRNQETNFVIKCLDISKLG